MDNNLATPLVQVFSVRIKAKKLRIPHRHIIIDPNAKRGNYKLHGTIRATERMLGSSVDLYNRGENEPLTLSKSATLLLTGPKDDALLPNSEITIDLCLKGTRGTEHFQGKHCLDPETEGIEGNYDKLKRAIIPGGDAFVYLYYATFQFAVSAMVEVTILKSSKGSSCAADTYGTSAAIYGSVVASYGNSRRYCSSENELKRLKTALFKQPSNQPLKMMFGTPFKFRSVAIPAYSSLIINMDLFDSQGRLARSVEEFQAGDNYSYEKSFSSKNGCVQLKVSFENAYDKMDEIREPTRCTTISVAKNTQDTETKTEQPSDYFQNLPELQLTPLIFYPGRRLPVDLTVFEEDMVPEDVTTPEDLTDSGSEFEEDMVPEDVTTPEDLTDSGSEFEDDMVPEDVTTPEDLTHSGSVFLGGTSIVEVFSVYIDGIHGEVCDLQGTIEVDDGLNNYYIYKTDPKGEILPYDRIAGIEARGPITNCEFSVEVDLKDPHEKLEISKGGFVWCIGNLENNFTRSAFDKRICSVVRGADGYAALHYMIFSNAIVAIVDVTFLCDELAGNPTNLSGVILARYGSHGYSTDYEKRYYQSRLFSRPESRPVSLKTGSKIPLSKSGVAVDGTSSLIIEAHLRAIGIDPLHDESFHMEKFVIGVPSPICKTFEGKFFRISVSVRFEMPYFGRFGKKRSFFGRESSHREI